MLRLRSFSKLGPYSGQVVGVGRETSAGIIEDFVRIDLEPGPKAIHYNAKNLSDTKDKLAAVITPSVGMRQADREVLYQDYLKGIANWSAETIWDWWRTGTKPTRVDAVEASVDEMQDGPEVEAVEEEPGEVQ